MTCIEINLQTATACGGERRNHLTNIVRLARTAWQRYWIRRAQKATVLILQSLDDRTLRDIGISPSEIESCVYGGGDRRRSYTFAS